MGVSCNRHMNIAGAYHENSDSGVGPGTPVLKTADLEVKPSPVSRCPTMAATTMAMPSAAGFELVVGLR